MEGERAALGCEAQSLLLLLLLLPLPLATH
jgi:hypothetical protein